VSALQGQSGKKMEHTFPLSASRLMARDYNGNISHDYPHAKNSTAAERFFMQLKMGIFTNISLQNP
jgi:hypothetical protein